MNNKSMSPALVYEFLATAVLTAIFNLGGTSGFAHALFFVSFICWQVSCAHFNAAITIA